MPFIQVGEENSQPIQIYYEDIGQGDPVVLIHGWPLNGRSWEKQVAVLVEAGYRVISYDRRGFGMSSKPSVGYYYDNFAADLNKLLIELDLNDVTLVGFSMGTGEVARYLGNFGSERIAKACMIGVIPPFLLKAGDNPTGVDLSVFDGIKQGLVNDRFAYLTQFFQNFYNLDRLLGSRISEEVVRWSWIAGTQASAIALLSCVDTWLEDFRSDVEKIDVPTLVIHGDQDRVLPIEATANLLVQKIPNSRFVVLKEGPHGLLWTHADEVNQALLSFLTEGAEARRVPPRAKRPEVRPELQ
jgi:pimeloyl-ACP methyl ester carboxylesterase